MESNRKIVHPLVVFLMAIFVVPVCFFLCQRIGFSLGSDLGAGYAMTRTPLILLFLFPLIVITVSGLLNLPVKTVHYIGLGIEFVTVFFNILLSRVIASQFLNVPDVIFAITSSCIVSSSVWALIGSAIAIPISMMLRNKGWIAYLAVEAIAGILVAIISYVLVRTGMSVKGIALGFLQPFCICPFLTAVSVAKKNAVPKTRSHVEKSTYSYLEQYKQNKKNGEN